MVSNPNISQVAALFADPARANMLGALMGGWALTASELAAAAGVTPQTASGHLAQMLAAAFVAVEKQGRHRYYRLSGADVANAIEALMVLSHTLQPRVVRPGPRDQELRLSRMCYDHLAGRMGVELFEKISRKKYVVLASGVLTISKRGALIFSDFGIDLRSLENSKRPVCLSCLDWSERKSHLAGALGASLLTRIFELGWAARVPGTRIVRFTSRGQVKFNDLFC